MTSQPRYGAEEFSKQSPTTKRVTLPAATQLRLFPLSALSGLAIAALLARFWRPSQTYPDVIAGVIAFANVSKTGDYLGLILILPLASLSFYCALRLAASAVRKTGDSKWLNSLLDIPLALLAYWAGVQLIGFDATPPYEVLLGSGLLLFLLPALLRSPSPSTRQLKQAGLFGFLDLLLLVFGGFGIGFALARVGHFAPQWVAQFAMAYTLSGVVVLITLVWRSAGLEQAHRKIIGLTYWFQIPLPLLLFAVLPRDTLYEQRRIVAESSYPLTGVLSAGCLVAWIFLYRRYRRQMGGISVRLRTHLEPLCLVAITTCLASRAVLPEIFGDDFHFGEQYLPWQQLVQFGRLPYIDLIPIHGTMPLITGALNSLFFQGAVGSFPNALLLFAAGASALTFLCLYRAGGLGPALLYLLCLNQIDRFYFFGPFLLLLTGPRRFRSQYSFLLAIAFTAFALTYNIPVGTALLIGLLPTMTVEAGWIWRAGYARSRPLVVIVGASVLVVAGVPVVRNTVRGFVQFAIETGATNSVAHGLVWEGISAVAPPNSNSVVSPLLFELMKFGWIPLVLMVIAGLISIAAARFSMLWKRENRLLVGFALSAIAMVPWSVTRIDPGLSRTGSFTAYCVAVFLPLLALRNGRACREAMSMLVPAMAFLLGLFAVQSGTVFCFSSISARLAPIVPVPGELTCVDGVRHGMPNLGRVCLPPARLNALTKFDRAVSSLVGPSGTYFDLTNRQALYSFTRREEPALYATPYIAVSHQQQEHVLQQLRTNPVKLVFAAPTMGFDGLPSSLRSYLFFRYVALSFRPCKIEDNLFLTAPSVDRSPCENAPDRQLWDEHYAHWNLEGLPSAWGGSWSSLKRLFVPVSVGLAPPRLRLEGLQENEKQQFTLTHSGFDEQSYLDRYPDIASAVKTGALSSGYQHYKFYGERERRIGSAAASFILDLRSLDVDPRYYDFLTFQLISDANAPKRLPLELRWVSDLGEVTQPVLFFVEDGRVVVPVGSYPQWLLARRIQSIRIGIANPVGFRIPEFQLLHYRPSDSVPKPW
jgi:hypothetical protein